MKFHKGDWVKDKITSELMVFDTYCDAKNNNIACVYGLEDDTDTSYFGKYVRMFVHIDNLIFIRKPDLESILIAHDVIYEEGLKEALESYIEEVKQIAMINNE